MVGVPAERRGSHRRGSLCTLTVAGWKMETLGWVEEQMGTARLGNTAGLGWRDYRDARSCGRL